MWKAEGAFRSIGEVADLIGVAPHVLRYWETQFSQLKPMKRPDGRRYYRPDDVRLAAGLCEVLRDEGLTIRGAKKMMAKDRGQSVRARGAARLGEVMGRALNGQPPEAATATRPARVGNQAEFADPVEDDLADEQTDHAPRSRHRRRGHAAPVARPTSPPPDSTDGTWLPRLVALSQRLRSVSGRNGTDDGLLAAADDLRAAIVRYSGKLSAG